MVKTEHLQKFRELFLEWKDDNEIKVNQRTQDPINYHRVAAIVGWCLCKVYNNDQTIFTDSRAWFFEWARQHKLSCYRVGAVEGIHNGRFALKQYPASYKRVFDEEITYKDYADFILQLLAPKRSPILIRTPIRRLLVIS